MSIKEIFENNKKWAKEQLKQNPKFFSALSKHQNPKYLWIGCSDSRVPTNQIMNLPAGDVFVHRNIANIVAFTDFNCLSAIEYAVEVLKVEDIIVCGHYGCGGIKAAIDGDAQGYVENWLSNIKDVIALNEKELQGLNEEQRYKRVCELNVIEQVNNVSLTTIIQKAWEKNPNLTIHGWIYCISDGILHSLEVKKYTPKIKKVI
jgi:carbonic anhydrase